MVLILLSIIVAFCVAWLLFWHSENGRVLEFVSGFLGLLMALGAGCAAIAYAFSAWSWMAAEHRANIVNREYGTNYTQEEIFYAKDVIETIRNLDRQRIEINGDIMRGIKEKK